LKKGLQENCFYRPHMQMIIGIY